MSQGKHTEARELMYSGALLFFSHGQQNSAADLSMLVLESLEKAEVDVTDELLGGQLPPPPTHPSTQLLAGLDSEVGKGLLWEHVAAGAAVGRSPLTAPAPRGTWGVQASNTPVLLSFRWTSLLFLTHGLQMHIQSVFLGYGSVSVVSGNLAKLFSLMDPNSPERVAFVSRALKWSGGGSGKLGHPRLHQLLALTLWKEQNYCESRYHFLHSADGEGCANMLVEYSTSRGFRSEVDMFVAQAVLQFLCLKNKSSASVVFTTYTQKHPSIENGPPFVQPLLNFIWFLLLAVDGGKLTVFTVLCEQYQPSLRRDPMYNEYLDRIGQLFFGVPPKQTSSYGGLLGNLLSSLMGSSEQEEGEESQEDSSPIELD
ncbi:Golgi to ER traffic protein 4 homolog isoform 1-T1 [Trichechus inunguis]